MEEIKVMVADASHEKYVDTILQTIADAARRKPCPKRRSINNRNFLVKI